LSTADVSDDPELRQPVPAWSLGQPHGWVVPLPGQADSRGVPSYLAEVDTVLATAVADLARLWTAELEDCGTVDVLTEADLPHLLSQLLSTGGKRIRPVMAYLGWLCGSGHANVCGYQHVVRVGAALELLHLFALVHDDVMDESDSRRGQPTVHARTARLHAEAAALGSSQRFGESIAILLGDLAHAYAAPN